MATKDYLAKKYGIELKSNSSGSVEKVKKKKKKPKPEQAQQSNGMRLIDADVDWETIDRNKEKPKESIHSFNLGFGSDEEDFVQVVEDVPEFKQTGEWVSYGLDENQKEKDSSPPRGRHDSPDNSPPRKRHDSPDNSPPRRARHDSPDNSPPRRKRLDSPDNSPPRKRHDSPDNSPPRRTRHDSPDNSPPRRARHDSPDNSPPRRKRHDSPNNSPPRRKRQHSPDRSPPRKGRKRSQERESSPPSYRFAETIHRDSMGRKINVKLEKLKEEEKKKKKEAEQEKHMAWGKGLVQQKEQEDKLKNLKELAAQPFARYKADLAQDFDIKNQSRWGDPMAGLVSDKKTASSTSSSSSHSKKKYKGIAPPNRFDILPGHRWDGVDRSNGYEKQFLRREAGKEAESENAYKWSTEDM